MICSLWTGSLFGKKNREEREGKKGKRAFRQQNVYQKHACDHHMFLREPTGDVIWLDVFQPLCGWKSKSGKKAHRNLRISKNILQLPFFREHFVAQYHGDSTEGWLMYLLKTLRLTGTILDKIRWKINPSSIL